MLGKIKIHVHFEKEWNGSLQLAKVQRGWLKHYVRPEDGWNEPFLFFSLWLGNLFAHFERNHGLSGRKFIARSFCFG